MAKTTKLTLYFLSYEPVTKIYKLLEEFPQIKLSGPRNEKERGLVYYDIRFPVVDRELITRYLQARKIAYF